MYPIDIVKKAFKFEETENIPYWIQYDSELKNKLDRYYGGKAWSEKIVPYMFGEDVINGEVSEKILENGYVQSPFGYEMRQGNIMHIERYPLEKPSMKGYRWPDAEEMADWKKIAEWYESAEGSYRLCGRPFGLFERAWTMRGMENLLVDMIEEPDFVMELMEGYIKLMRDVYTLINERIPCEAIKGGDDVSGQNGLFMGIDRWRKFIKPYFKAEIDHVHSLGKPYIAHMCGNVMPIVDDLVEIGLDGLESLQSEAMNVYELKRKVTGKIVLIGGFGVQKVLPFGTPREVREEVRKLKKELGHKGGYILAASKPLTDGIPVENAAAFIEEVLA